MTELEARIIAFIREQGGEVSCEKLSLEFGGTATEMPPDLETALENLVRTEYVYLPVQTAFLTVKAKEK